MEPALHWICHQLPFFSVLLCSKRQSIYFKKGSLHFPPSSDVFEQPSFTGEQSMGVGLFLLWQCETFWVSATEREPFSRAKQTVLDSYQSCCRGNSPLGAERFRNCSHPAWPTWWNPCQKERTFLCVSFDIVIPVFHLCGLQHAKLLERWEGKRSHTQISM